MIAECIDGAFTSFRDRYRRAITAGGPDRGAFSLPETSSLRMLVSATDWRRIAFFDGLLNRSPISGNGPYLFG
jgi:hypothetical protein